MEIIGETTDDAVGEAFDKSAKILGLPYPGGPLVDKNAQLGNPTAFAFTKPKVPGLDFSFSGLKTAILYFIQKNIAEPVIMDTVIAEQTQTKVWPIKVENVEKSYEKDTPKWQVVAENGVMYYTNKKPKIGDIAFYINDNDEITDKYGRVERTR
jgi:tRNA A37 threonylcarbamoyltransferase TsaD